MKITTKNQNNKSNSYKSNKCKKMIKKNKNLLNIPQMIIFKLDIRFVKHFIKFMILMNDICEFSL